MIIDDWIAEQKAELDKFLEAWERKADNDPQHWPADMKPTEWDEMFLIYKDQKPCLPMSTEQ